MPRKTFFAPIWEDVHHLSIAYRVLQSGPVSRVEELAVHLDEAFLDVRSTEQETLELLREDVPRTNREPWLARDLFLQRLGLRQRAELDVGEVTDLVVVV